MTDLDKVFVVYGECGSYSDYTKWSVCACTTLELADAIAKRLQAAVKSSRDLRGRQYSEFEAPYTSSHPKKWLLCSRPKVSSDLFRLHLLCRVGGGTEQDKEDLRKMQAAYEGELNAYLAEIESVSSKDRWYADYETALKAWREVQPETKEVEWAKAFDSAFSDYDTEYSGYELSIVKEMTHESH